MTGDPPSVQAVMDAWANYNETAVRRSRPDDFSARIELDGDDFEIWSWLLVEDFLLGFCPDRKERGLFRDALKWHYVTGDTFSFGKWGQILWQAFQLGMRRLVKEEWQKKLPSVQVVDRYQYIPEAENDGE